MKTQQAPDVGLLLLRCGLGVIFILHGWIKLFGNEVSFIQEMLNIAGVTMPGVLLYVAAIVELLCGLLLIAGIMTRMAAGLLAAEMFVVVLLFHLREGFFIVAVPNVPLAYGFEFHLALVAGLLCLVFCGPGAWCLRKPGAASSESPRPGPPSAERESHNKRRK